MTAAPEPPNGGGRRQMAALVLALLAVSVVATVNNLGRSIWVDEAFSLRTASRPLPETVRQAARFEMQPPLYFVLLNLWLRLSATLEAARALSTVCVLLTLWTLYRLGLVLGLEARGVSLPLLCALVPFVLWTASEARAYALTLLLTTAATYFYTRVFLCPGERPRGAAAAYVVCAWASLLTFYLSGFLLLAQGVAGLLFSRRRVLLVLCLALVGVLMVPWLPTIASQVDAHPIENPPLAFMSEEGLARAAGALSWIGQSLLDVLFPVPVMRRPLVRAGTLLLVAAVVALRVLRGRAWGRIEGAFAIASLVPFLLVGLLQALDLAWILERHRVAAVSNLIVFGAVVMAGVEPSRLRAAVTAAVTAALAVTAVSFQRNNAPPHDWRAAAAFVQQRSVPGEPVVVFEPEQAIAFGYYFRGANDVLGMPRDAGPHVYSREEQAVRSEAEVAERLRTTVGAGRTFWLIANAYALPRTHAGTPSHLERRLGGGVLQGYVLRETEVVASQEFRGIRVWHLRTRPRA